jgi:hypothetical protein
MGQGSRDELQTVPKRVGVLVVRLMRGCGSARAPTTEMGQGAQSAAHAVFVVFLIFVFVFMQLD